MRLIDADLLVKKCKCTGKFEDNFKCVSLAELKKVIENQPTAFEIETVIKRLKILRVKTTEDPCPGAECERCMYSDICIDASCADVHALDSAIEIVKRGGSDEE